MSANYSLMQMYKDAQYTDVTAVWSNAEEVSTFNEWDYLAVMNSYYALKQYSVCKEVYKRFHAKYPESDMLNDKLGWAVYFADIKSFDPQREDSGKVLREIEYIMRHSSGGRYSPCFMIIKQLTKKDDYKSGIFLSNEKLNEYLSCVDPSALSTEEPLYNVEDRSKPVAAASDMEKWYAMKSGVLYRLKKYDECIECCDRALSLLTRFHSNNDSWLRYKKAACLCETGRTDEAKQLIDKIVLSGFNSWCIQEMLFRLEKDTEKALVYGCKCAVTDNEHKGRVRFYPAFADFLDRIGKKREAMLHRKLTVLLREENGWGIKESQRQWQFDDDISAMSTGKALNELNRFWRGIVEKSRTYYTGTIKCILKEGMSGFIKCDDDSSYYFRLRDMNGPQIMPEVGTKVRFEKIVKNVNGAEKTNAVNISIIK